MKKILSSLAPFILVLGAAAVLFLFNYTVIDVRLEDLDYLLRDAAKAQDENRSLGMLARYELIRRRMERGRENTVDYEMETRVQAVLSGGSGESDRASATKQALKGPARLFLNVVRVLMGKETRSKEKDVSAEEKIIEVAYFWERNRHYDKAEKLYGDLLGNPNLTDDFRRYVFLHRGFCLSMVSKYQDAKKAYEQVISEYPESEAAVVAWKLIDFLEGIQRELSFLKKEGLPSFERGKKLFLLMDYRGAIKLFSIFLQGSSSSNTALEIRFLKGRAHEELGENKEALEEYRGILSRAPRSTWGREANRRIYILGEFYERDKEMTKRAMEHIQEYRDASFFNKMKTYSNMMEESDQEKNLRIALVREQVKSGSKGLSAKDIANMLDGIDLDGKKRARDQEKRDDAIEAAKKKLEDVKVKEIEIQKSSEHPMRSRKAFSTVVKRKVDELEYIYKKAIRGGRVFEGRFMVRIQILPSGQVGKVEGVSSTLNNPAFEKAVMRKIKSWRFLKVPQSVGATVFVYPFEFRKVE